jgi:hypothetical protein
MYVYAGSITVYVVFHFIISDPSGVATLHAQGLLLPLMIVCKLPIFFVVCRVPPPHSAFLLSPVAHTVLTLCISSFRLVHDPTILTFLFELYCLYLPLLS